MKVHIIQQLILMIKMNLIDIVSVILNHSQNHIVNYLWSRTHFISVYNHIQLLFYIISRAIITLNKNVAFRVTYII